MMLLLARRPLSKRAMWIELTTGSEIQGTPHLVELVHQWAEGPLARFGSRFSRLGVHLGTENADAKSGKREIRCAIEARLKHREPVVAVHRAESVETAVRGAARKLQRVIATDLSRLDEN